MPVQKPKDLPTIYPPHTLRDYAMLADGCRGALIGPRGDISWLCAPGWDSPAVISHLVGGDGIYALSPSETYVWGGSYEDDSLIWRSRWVTTSSIIESREALAFPGDPHRLVLLRRIKAADQPVELDAVLRLSADFGQTPMSRPHQDGEGHWECRVGALYARWCGAPEARWEDHALRGRFILEAGRHHDVILEISDQPLPPPPDADQAWSSTRNAWQAAIPVGRWAVPILAQRDLRSATGDQDGTPRTHDFGRPDESHPRHRRVNRERFGHLRRRHRRVAAQPRDTQHPRPDRLGLAQSGWLGLVTWTDEVRAQPFPTSDIGAAIS